MMKLSEQIFRVLLKAYPRRYRERYDAPMGQLFSDQLRHVNGRHGLVRLWLRTLTDLLRTVPAQYLEKLHLHGGKPYGEPVRRCLFVARCEAEGFGSKYITPKHILLGVLHQDLGMRSCLNPLALDDIRHAIAISVLGRPSAPDRDVSYRCEPGGKSSFRTDLPLNDACKRIWGFALEEAEKAGRSQIAPRDLVAGILRDEQTLAAELLARYQIDLERLRSGW